MNAFYLINKPLWITSFDVIRVLKKKLQIKRIWHAWTLDPLASGLLLIATGNYTKLLSYCIIKEKTYSFDIHLNGISPSYDLGTKVEYLNSEKQEFLKKNLFKKEIENLIEKKYLWDIIQIPPKYSALKIWGKRALDRVISWESFEIKERNVFIYHFEIKEFSYPIVSCEAEVSSGTYIRSFAYDIGQDLWSGWYIGRLCRTKLGSISLEEAQDLDCFDQRKKYSEKKIFWDSRIISVSDEVLEKLYSWQNVIWDFPFEKDIPLFIEKNGEIVSVCLYQDNLLIPKRKI